MMLRETTRSLVLVSSVLLLAGGCKSDGAEAEASVAPDERGTAVAAVDSPENIDPYWAEGKTVKTSEPKNRGGSVDIFIDPALAKVCGYTEPEVYFAFDSAAVKDAGHDKLGSLAECLNSGKVSAERIEIVGHADPRGTEEYNRGLGLERANSVAAALKDHGVDSTRLSTSSRGEQKASDDPAQWQNDRRVEIRIAK